MSCLTLIQGHEQNSTEMGYLLTTEELNAGDYDEEKTSVRLLAEDTGLDGETLLTGAEESLGAMLEERGYHALPSPRQPAPGGEQELKIFYYSVCARTQDVY